MVTIDAQPSDRVIIDSGVNPAITGAQIAISDNGLQIIGQGAGSTTVSRTSGIGRIFQVDGGVTAAISAMTLSGGIAADGADGSKPSTEPTGGQDGGAVLNLGNLTLSQVTITGNSTGAGGNGANGTATSANGQNGARGGDGGGVASAGMLLSVVASTIADNNAGAGGDGADGFLGGAGGFGGAGGGGGAVFIDSGGANFINSTFGGASPASGNTAGTGGDGGFMGAGGISNGSGGTGGAGGAIRLDQSTGAGLTNSTIVNNSAGVGGAGTSVLGSASGGSGGGIESSGTLVVQHATTTGNAAGPSAAGGGIWLETGVIDLYNTIVFGNSGLAPQCAGNIFGMTTINDHGHNLAPSPCGTVTGDPLLEPLGSNGGPTQTMGLGAGSAARDEIPPGADCPLTVDQRGPGFPRPSGSGCDIGAFEVQVSTAPTQPFTGGAGSAPTSTPGNAAGNRCKTKKKKKAKSSATTAKKKRRKC